MDGGRRHSGGKQSLKPMSPRATGQSNMFQLTTNCDMYLIHVTSNDISGKRVRVPMALRHVMKRVAGLRCGRPSEEGENAACGKLQRHRRQWIILREAVGEGGVGGRVAATGQGERGVEVALGGGREAPASSSSFQARRTRPLSLAFSVQLRSSVRLSDHLAVVAAPAAAGACCLCRPSFPAARSTPPSMASARAGGKSEGN